MDVTLLAQRSAHWLQVLRSQPDGHARLQYLITLAAERPALPDAERTDDRLVEGCVARLWLVAEHHGDTCTFRCDSDSLVVKSVAGLLCDFYSGATREEIIGTEPHFLREAGITAHLGANRRNALTRVRGAIRAFAKNASPGP